jgi:hypothetical protein
MFGKVTAAAAIAAMILCPSAASAKTYRLAPSSKWLMDYAPDACRLGRAFGEGDEQVVATFTRYAPGAAFALDLIGHPVRAAANEPDVRLRFGESGEFVRTQAMTGTSGKVPALFLSGRLDNLDDPDLEPKDIVKLSAAERAALMTVDPATEAAVRSATIAFGGRTIVLELGSMGGPMAEMRKCTADLVKEWGLDPVEQERLLRPVVPMSSPGTWLRSADYPTDSLMQGQQAIVRFRLMVDAAGRPTQCAVQSAIAKDDFGQVSCDLLKRRARFRPALSADGRPVASYYVSTVRWVIR